MLSNQSEVGFSSSDPGGNPIKHPSGTFPPQRIAPTPLIELSAPVSLLSRWRTWSSLTIVRRQAAWIACAPSFFQTVVGSTSFSRYCSQSSRGLRVCSALSSGTWNGLPSCTPSRIVSSLAPFFPIGYVETTIQQRMAPFHPEVLRWVTSSRQPPLCGLVRRRLGQGPQQHVSGRHHLLHRCVHPAPPPSTSTVQPRGGHCWAPLGKKDVGRTISGAVAPQSVRENAIGLHFYPIDQEAARSCDECLSSVR